MRVFVQVVSILTAQRELPIAPKKTSTVFDNVLEHDKEATRSARKHGILWNTSYLWPLLQSNHFDWLIIPTDVALTLTYSLCGCTSRQTAEQFGRTTDGMMSAHVSWNLLPPQSKYDQHYFYSWRIKNSSQWFVRSKIKKLQATFFILIFFLFCLTRLPIFRIYRLQIFGMTILVDFLLTHKFAIEMCLTFYRLQVDFMHDD